MIRLIQELFGQTLRESSYGSAIRLVLQKRTALIGPDLIFPGLRVTAGCETVARLGGAK
jgi:hypothetical protein